MINCAFLPVFYEVHYNRKYGISVPALAADYDHTENIWLSFLGLGKFEIYNFIYAECRDLNHFKEWITDLKGKDFLDHNITQFNNWLDQQNSGTEDTHKGPAIINPARLQFWEEQGYLKVSDLIDHTLCDDVRTLICTHLNIDLSDPSSWYTNHPDRQGLMLQVYQEPRMELIRRHPKVHQLFSELYDTQQIIPNTEKLSFNPPETTAWKFKDNILHWDIDLSKGKEYYIQGLIYLDDVPEDRGPFTLVPGFHHQFDDWIKSFETLQDAHLAMRETAQRIPVPGKKGDIIVWRHTLPHAASANNSSLPRFVQYLSFSKL